MSKHGPDIGPSWDADLLRFHSDFAFFWVEELEGIPRDAPDELFRY